VINGDRYLSESLSDLIGIHLTVARQNGWPGGDKERMEHGAGCKKAASIEHGAWGMEFKDKLQSDMIRSESSASSSAASHCAVYDLTKT
jgi:hypothetical protein